MTQNDENDPFAGFEVVDTYTTREALEDGVLVDLHAIGKIPVYAPVYSYIRYATRSLLSRGYMDPDGGGDVFNRPNLADLLVQASQGIKRGLAKGEGRLFEFRVEFPDGTRGEVWAAPNEEGTLTLMLPEDY